MLRPTFWVCCLALSTVAGCDPGAGPGTPAAASRLVALVDGSTLVRAEATGVTPLFTFGVGVDADFVSVLQWARAGDFMGGYAFLPLGDVLTYEYVLMSTDGRVLFHARRVESGHPTVYVGVDGSLAVAANEGFIAHADGTVTTLPGLWPLSPVLAGGALVVSEGEPWRSPVRKGLWRDGRLDPLPVELAFEELVLDVPGRALAVVGDDLVSLEDGQRVRLPKPGMGVVRQADDRWVLLAAQGGPAVVVDLASWRAQPLVNHSVPDATHGDWNLSVGEGGMVLQTEAREGGALQLRGSTDFGHSWTDVGEPLAPGRDLGLGSWLYPTARGGAVMIFHGSTGYGRFSNAVQWVGASGARQLATGGFSLPYAVSLEAAQLSPDGQAVATWTSGGGAAALVLLPAAGEPRTLLTSSEVGWFAFVP